MVNTYPIPPLVEIFWWDHYSIGDDWIEPGHKHKPCILSAVGYIVDQNDYYYWVASTYELSSGSYSSGSAILKNCVSHINNLRGVVDVNWDGTPAKALTKKKRGNPTKP